MFAFEGCALVSILAIYRKGERELAVFLTRPSGVALVLAVLGMVATALVMGLLVWKAGPVRARVLWIAAGANLLSVAAACLVGEVIVRSFAVERPGVTRFANKRLLPRVWADVAAQGRALLARASEQGSFLVYDDELGWTVGPGRQSRDYNRVFLQALSPELRPRYPENYPEQIYASSEEGIRSRVPGVRLSEQRASHRIAAVGDSFTFGLEVSYDETWTHQLELLLGDEVQVLNFGVDGYGVDQSYLRYRRDVLPWKPAVMILGLIDNDLWRTLGVYGFLSFPGAEIPFPKPRFELQGKGLALVNHPLPTPDFMFSRRSIGELPFVSYDPRYVPSDWEWRFYDHSYAIRLLRALAVRPGGGDASPAAARSLKSLNGEIFRRFVELARSQRSVPLVVVFPTAWDLHLDSLGRQTTALELLQELGDVPYLDTTPCIRSVPEDQRFVVLHYSAASNQAVASCLRDRVAEALRRQWPTAAP